jgi:hypothetical protein
MAILLLLSHLLRKHPVWKYTHARLFAVADQGSDDPEQVKRELETYVKDFRLNIEVHVKVIDPNLDIELHQEAQEQLQKEAEKAAKATEKPVELSDVVPQCPDGNMSPRSNVYALDDLISGAVEYPTDLLLALEKRQEDIPDELSKQQPERQVSDETPKKNPSQSSFGSGLAKMRSAPRDPSGKSFPNTPPSSIGEQAKSGETAKDLPPPGPVISGPLTLPSKTDSKERPSKFDSKLFLHSGTQLSSSKACSVEELMLAKGLNRLMLQESKEAELVITNLPDMPPGESALGYCQLVNTMTQGLKRCFLVRGTASEVITAFT